ncbi:unnamed protein product [Chilo suppressalis]|uniref:XRCC4 N-terminal domain-containing protein n=1 Tax=Chilo suppressalis TaxID=168631 RepID=A0ABN8AW04_CHISP|nr:unnamed protein product [Chilo suppressalis]
MDIDESITVTKISNPNEQYYLLVGWQLNSFEMYLYTKDQLWKGKFSSNRLTGFSQNLNISEMEYYKKCRHCLSEQIEDYQYEMKSGLFYWKKKYADSLVIEGFLPLELDASPSHSRPDLFEILLVLNKNLKEKLVRIKRNCKTLRKDFYKCLKDTEEFLYLKIEMEKTLCDRFLHVLNSKRSGSKTTTIDKKTISSVRN